jgi:hypothetical protein
MESCCDSASNLPAADIAEAGPPCCSRIVTFDSELGISDEGLVGVFEKAPRSPKTYAKDPCATTLRHQWLRHSRIATRANAPR